jgi:hypothetical protein
VRRICERNDDILQALDCSSSFVASLTSHGYNISAQTLQKTSLPLLMCSLVDVKICLFAEALLSNGCFTVACFAVVAEQQV